MKYTNIIQLFLLSLSPLAAQSAITKQAVPGEYIVKLKKNHFLPLGASDLDAENIILSQPLSEAAGLIKLVLNPQQEAQILNDLATKSAVEYVEPNYIIQLDPIGTQSPLLRPNDPLLSNQWALDNIQYFEALDLGMEATAEVLVAVIDTGVDSTNPEFAGRLYENPGESGELANNGIDDDGDGYIDNYSGWNTIENNNNYMDDQGHGTHCAGIIAANSNNAEGIVGLSANVKLLPVKFLNRNGVGSIADAIEALEYARKMGAQISNNSWGGGEFSQALSDEIAAASNSLLVMAAGNSGIDTDQIPTYPASFDHNNILSVTSINIDNEFPENYANFGATSVDIAAPGEEIISSILNNRYQAWSGTSMAAPHASGIAALLLSIKPNLSVSELKSILLDSSESVPALEGKIVSGGKLNAARALQSLQQNRL